MSASAAPQEQDAVQAPDLASYAPAYREDIRALLRHIASYVTQITADFVNHFYDALTHRPPTAAILKRLSPDQLRHLRIKQARHLCLLMSPTLTAQHHFEQAQTVGFVHEMIGIELPSLLEAYHLYQLEIGRMLPACGLEQQEQEHLGQALQQRLMLDMEAQITSHYRVGRDMSAFLTEFEETTRDAGNLTDLLQAGMHNISGVDGIIACLFLRPDAQGVLQIEAAGCTAGQEYAESMQKRRVPFIEINPDTPAGQGPSGSAWRTAHIQTVDSYGNDTNLHPWQKTGVEFGFRSSASVPLLDEAGQPFALLSLYSQWPGFFETPARQAMLRHIQQVLGHAVLQREQGLVIPVQLRREYRRRLDEGAIRLLYQPIIDLHSGRLLHVEALARLRAADGKILTPAAFLPAFGKTDQLRLFQLGLQQACRDSRAWHEQGMAVSVSINLPAEGLTDDAYSYALFEALDKGDAVAANLRLEILESHEPVDLDKRDARIAEFQQAGLAIVQDDLGSGHSSLLRMDRIAFDEVKIDQGLVRNALSTPQRAIEFIYHLTRLAHGFNVPVTVEGLESRGLIEAAAILGADHGQGYGIARPMSAFELIPWQARFVYDIDPAQPTTPLGALAAYLLWDQQLAALSRWPDLIEDFVRSPSLLQRYLDTQGEDNDSQLRTLVQSNHACALRGQNSTMYTHTKNELIRQLSQKWLQQTE